MRTTMIVVVLLGLLGLGWGLAQRHQDAGLTHAGDGGPTPTPGPGEAQRAAGSPAAARTPDAGSAEQVVQAESDSSFEAAFRNSDDFWQFSESIYPAAKGGDPAAQYYLHRALDYCKELYRFYFVRGDKRRTIDEAMQWASTRTGVSADEAREVHARCRRLQESPHSFGTSDEWLSASRGNGYALAMVESAQKLTNAAGAGGQAENIEMRKEAKHLALQALRSKEPEVVFMFGDLATLFYGDSERASQEQWVWRLAACQRGFDCGPQAEWLKFLCRFDTNCQPNESGTELIRRASGASFDEVERQAKELNAKIDAGDLADLGS